MGLEKKQGLTFCGGLGYPLSDSCSWKFFSHSSEQKLFFSYSGRSSTLNAPGICLAKAAQEVSFLNAYSILIQPRATPSRKTKYALANIRDKFLILTTLFSLRPLRRRLAGLLVYLSPRHGQPFLVPRKHRYQSCEHGQVPTLLELRKWG